MLFPVAAKEEWRKGGRFVRIDASGIRSISRTLISTEIGGKRSQLFFAMYEKLGCLGRERVAEDRLFAPGE